jgi:hypothetical protein
MPAKFNLPPDAQARLDMLSKHSGSNVAGPKPEKEAVGAKADARVKDARQINGSKKT